LVQYLDQNPEVPFETLRYVIAEINYGGRVTDRIDIRLIVGVLKKYMHKDIMKNDFPYSADGVYYNPESLELENITKMLESLPLEDNTYIFGMHSNALITFQQKTVKEFVNTLLIMQPRAAGGGGDGIKVEDLVYMQAGEMYDRIPNKIEFDPNQLANPLEVFRR